MTFTLIREMGLSHADFFRTLPHAMLGLPFQIAGSVVTVAERPRRITITLAPETERRIAQLCLPVTQVTFEFCGYTEDERTVFMRHFERCYQRGGG